MVSKPKDTLETLAILGKHNVGLVSIAENIDYSRPEGMLFTQMLGAFAQYYSSALGTHVKKGLEQRALEGKHTGGIPFGYESCWINNDKGEKQLRCQPEHPGGIHVHQRRGGGYRIIRYLCRGQCHLEPASRLAEWPGLADPQYAPAAGCLW